MALRDLLLLAIVAFWAVQALRQPWLGVLLLAWIGFMNPHRLTWGIAQDLPWAAMAFAVTLLALLFHWKKDYRIPWAPPLVWQTLFISWVLLATLFAMFPASAGEIGRFLKIQLMLLLTYLLIRERRQLFVLVAVVTGSILFYGLKGGIFALMTGAQYRVWGPEKSFISGNNELALAILVCLPLGYFLYHLVSARSRWLGWLCIVTMLFSVLSVLASYSRGAAVTIVAIGCYFWFKSRQKLPIALVIILLVVGLSPFLPETWYARIDTIADYQQDASAMGRLNSWVMAINLASDRLTGGGFGAFTRLNFLVYAPDPTDVHDAHSIYFEVLGEQGWTGLLLFLGMYISCWRLAGKVRRKAREQQDASLALLADMCKVSLLAYAVGGTFLGLAYWDLPYYLIAFVVISHRLLIPETQPVPVWNKGRLPHGAA